MSRTTQRNTERREIQRAYFTLEENITARISMKERENDTTPIQVKVLTISIGGISFLTTKYKLPICKVGEQLRVENLKMPLPLGIIDEMSVEIKYIMEEENHRIVLGAEFIDILQLYRKRIYEYVRERLSTLGLKK